ncbi:hypothetical protein ACSX1A_11325 [Pontibacter sp. MBLB2868]|uniref:hypothetical protein n=1 Tax=Pontibacter sp. MBLB2868 TaxID=3451555 RepID=UPI003F74B810
MKASRSMSIALFLALSLVALGASLQAQTNDPLREGKYYQLDYEEYIGVVGKGDTLRPGHIDKKEIADLNRLIVRYVQEKNKALEPKINKEIQRSPHHAEMIKNSNYLFEPEAYYYQLLSAVNSNGQKLIFVNAIHSSFLKNNKELDELRVVADGRNMYFNFWVNLATGEIQK